MRKTRIIKDWHKCPENPAWRQIHCASGWGWVRRIIPRGGWEFETCNSSEGYAASRKHAMQIVETILRVRREPAIPPPWDGYELWYPKCGEQVPVGALLHLPKKGWCEVEHMFMPGVYFTSLLEEGTIAYARPIRKEQP